MKAIQKIILLFILIFTFGNIALAQSSDDHQYFYLVRHAEKADDGTKDPPLTKEGERRAKKLAVVLNTANIQNIYSTDYKRTRSTVTPLSEDKGLTINLYNPSDAAFIKNLMNAQGNTVVSGHSNSTPTLVNKLLGKEKYEQLDHSEYGTIFVLCKIGDSFGSAIMKY